MNQTDNVEKMIENTKIRTNPEVNNAVLNGLIEQMEEPENANISHNQKKNRSLIAQYISAAAVFILAVVGIWFLQGVIKNGVGPNTKGNEIVVKKPEDQLTEKSSETGKANGSAEKNTEYLALNTTTLKGPVKPDLETINTSTVVRNLWTMNAGTVGPDRATAYPYAGLKRADNERLEAEAKKIKEMAAGGDIEGLIKMLSSGMFRNKITAAEHLGRIGDERALPELKKCKELYICGLSKNGSKVFRGDGYGYSKGISSGAFAVAICKIRTRDLTEKEQINTFFEVLDDCIEPEMPDPNKPYLLLSLDRSGLTDIPINEYGFGSFDLGKRVAAELEKYDDPSIVTRLRKSENKGAAITGVWMEVKDMPQKKAIDRCLEIAITENEAQQYGAIKCLGKLGKDAINALDELGWIGQYEAIRTLGYLKKEPEVMKMICRHISDNDTYLVRLLGISQFSHHNIVKYQQPALLDSLVKVLYDPEKAIRRRAAGMLRTIAKGEKWSDLIKYEDELKMALEHDDKEIRGFAGQTLKILDDKILNEEK